VQTLPGSWETRAPLPYRVQEIYPALHEGRIWVAGGLSPDVAEGGDIGLSDRVVVYDPATDVWSDGPSLPEPRHHPYLVSTEEGLFVFGGFVAGEGGVWSGSADVLRLDEEAGRWERVAELLHPQSETVAAVLGGVVYLATGRAPEGEANADWDDQSDMARVQRFDPATLQVSAGPAAPTARNSAAGAVLEGKLYVVGGRTVEGGNRADAEVFDPATGAWERLTPMPEPQGGIAAAAHQGRLYVFGGEFFGAGGSGVHERSWVYEPADDAWEEIVPMPVPRHGLGAVTVGDAIYVVAGASEAGGSGTSDRLSVFRP
jgi:N-acetylneuraminic acid mutarotase